VLVTPLAGSESGFTSWLDLERALVFTGPALVPLSQPWMWTPEGGIDHIDSRHLIATSPGSSTDFWHIDLDRGTYDHLGTIEDCHYSLAVIDLDPSGTRVLLDCNDTDPEGSRRSPPVGAEPGWVEIVDLAARTRYRATNVLGGKLVAGGAVGSFTTRADARDARKRPGAGRRALNVPYESRLVLVTPGQ
jgi:hypothetical protein